MDVNPELISRYADGCVTADEAVAVEAAIARDPVLAADLEDFRMVAGLFGHAAPEQVSDRLTRRLHALDVTSPAAGFKIVRAAPAPPRISWRTYAASIAALLLLAIGVFQATRRADVVLRDVTRLAADLTDLQRLPEVTVKAGDTLRAGEGERLSFQTVDGDRVTLLPGGALAIGDPLDGELFELERGTTLCSVLTHDGARTVHAGPYRIRVTHAAHFGVEITDPDVRPAGGALGSTEVIVTVSHGAVEILKNGDRETVSAYERAVFTSRGETRTHAAEDPVFFELMRSFREHSREILPGFFTGEPGVSVIQQRWVHEAGGTCVLALSDGGVGALGATHLVLRVRASEPGPLRITRLRPLADQAGEAEASTLFTPPVGTDWTIVAIPRADFDGPSAERTVRRVGEDRSRLVRLELKASDPRTRIDVQNSLWAARPPVELPEVSK